MSEAALRFLPVPGPATQPFWDGCSQGELRLQRCRGCDHWQFYPRILCTACGGRELEWQAASGRGTLRSYSVVRRPVSEAYAEDVPYVVVLVALAEGPTLMSQLVGADPESVHIGTAVRVRFVPWSESITMPLFEPEPSA